MEEREGYVVKHTLEGQKELQEWAKYLGMQLPVDCKLDAGEFSYIQACSAFRAIGLLPVSESPNLNAIQLAALAAFPEVEKTFYAKLSEGYKLVEMTYEAKEQTGHESLNIVLRKEYGRFVLTQGKGCYAGGYSRATFGREGERGEVI